MFMAPMCGTWGRSVLARPGVPGVPGAWGFVISCRRPQGTGSVVKKLLFHLVPRYVSRICRGIRPVSMSVGK